MFLLVSDRGKMAVVGVFLAFINGVVPGHRCGMKRVAGGGVVGVLVHVGARWTHWYIFKQND